jgi:AraC-like DNA-binding protein
MLQPINPPRRRTRPASATAPDQPGEVRLAPLRSIAGLMREMGHDPAQALAACGLPASALDDPARTAPLHVAAALIQRAAWTTGRKDFGLLIGQRFEIGDLGLLGQLMWRARTVGEALHDLLRFLHLQDRGSVVYVNLLDDGRATLGYSILDPRARGVGLAYDAVIAMAMKILRTVCGPQFKPLEVWLAHAAPDDTAPYRRCFAAPVVFEAARSEIHFSADWLGRPVAGADAALHAAVQHAARSAEAEHLRTMAERVRGVVQALLVGGDVSAARVAHALGLHERTLRRRLAEEGASLQQLIAAARFEVAGQLLRETRLTLRDIATAVGYAEAPVFVRAFRRWAGCTPARWRVCALTDAGSTPEEGLPE